MRRIGLLCLVAAGALVFFLGWQFWTLDDQVQSAIQTQVDAALKSHHSRKLRKICGDKHTYRYLSKQKQATVHVESDNQGGGNVAYYRMKLGHQDNYGVEFKIKNEVFYQFGPAKIYYVANWPK
ncbi:hypothetical protein HMPREF9103_03019 [Lentilactobacillus parafarraginis F0439]|uniref:Uncharacterized protein n=1 Tax=Lentilactobacillus parafarraginis F0439 TaxID=797515 RepID=G9ZTD4_9LACO|nr:hypothetical protein [Lentilactobacillus parafarraginis]EHL95349.1 hypothetical protein HMPREF9103_03019 [Lentilactobacillus parafarraginis F0439]